MISKPASNWLASPWRIALVALLVRLAYITVAHSYRFHAVADHFEFGWEMGRVGRSLALGRGFADPFMPTGTGPTAWMPPLYPLIVGGVFRVLGVYTPLSGWALLAINSVFNAATVPAVYELAARCFGGARAGVPAGAEIASGGEASRRGRAIALWSAWIWALYPATMQYAVRWIWEMSLTTMLFAWVLVATLRLRGVGGDGRGDVTPQLRLWGAFGLVWGLIALSNATPLLLLPVCGLWIVAGAANRRGAIAGAANRRGAIAGAAMAAVVFCACLTPWAWRNWTVFDAFISTRGNLGAELYVGNGPQANGFPWGITVFSRPDLESYRRMGEVAFVRERGRLATEWISEHPLRLVELSLKRVYFYWVNVPHPADRHWLLEAVRETTFCLLSVTGWLGLVLALRRRAPGAGLFAWAFALLPVTYYFVTAGARFRHPLEPLLVILSVYLFASAERGRRRLSTVIANS